MSAWITIILVGLLSAPEVPALIPQRLSKPGRAAPPMIATAWHLAPEKVLTREEVQQILAAAKRRDLRDYVFFTLAANTGLRLCEVIHIRGENLDRGQFTITRRKKRVLRPELIDVPDGLYELAKKWTNGSPDYLFPGRQAPCFINHLKGEPEKVCDGGHASKRNLQRRWGMCCEDAGVKMRGRGIHTLRHYAISEFYDQHRDLRAAQLFAGHSSPMITRVYAHVRDMKEKVKAMEVTL